MSASAPFGPVECLHRDRMPDCMLPTFSTRTQWDLRETAYAAALRHARSQPQPIFDLTASNPTTCGFVYEDNHWRDLLHAPECRIYEPNPQGLRSAREAVAAYYQEATGARPDPDSIVLTTSTSEAYSFLFRLLCDHGDEVLIAQPSYPLFEFLADLDHVRLVSYPLFYDHGWHLDLAALRERITPRTRAIVVVQPNNPTGHFTKKAERRELETICEQYGLALIVDEVFLDYAGNSSRDGLGKFCLNSTVVPQWLKPDFIADAYGGTKVPPLQNADSFRDSLDGNDSFSTDEHPALTFILSGLSKVSALPQMKVAWMLCLGPQDALQQARSRLEIIADTFLSMNAPIQHALPGMLASRHAMQRQILERTQANLSELDRQLQTQTMISRLTVEAGWYAVLRVPALGSVDAAAIRLLETERVLAHPGHFYGFAGDGWLVVSLLPPLAEFQEGMARMTRFFQSPSAPESLR